MAPNKIRQLLLRKVLGQAVFAKAMTEPEHPEKQDSTQPQDQWQDEPERYAADIQHRKTDQKYH